LMAPEFTVAEYIGVYKRISSTPSGGSSLAAKLERLVYTACLIPYGSVPGQFLPEEQIEWVGNITGVKTLKLPRNCGVMLSVQLSTALAIDSKIGEKTLRSLQYLRNGDEGYQRMIEDTLIRFVGYHSDLSGRLTKHIFAHFKAEVDYFENPDDEASWSSLQGKMGVATEELQAVDFMEVTLPDDAGAITQDQRDARSKWEENRKRTNEVLQKTKAEARALASKRKRKSVTFDYLEKVSIRMGTDIERVSEPRGSGKTRTAVKMLLGADSAERKKNLKQEYDKFREDLIRNQPRGQLSRIKPDEFRELQSLCVEKKIDQLVMQSAIRNVLLVPDDMLRQKMIGSVITKIQLGEFQEDDDSEEQRDPFENAEQAEFDLFA